MNSGIEAEKFEPKKKIENKIDEIKSDHMKSIIYLDINISAIKSNKPENIYADLMPWILLKSPEQSPQFASHLYSLNLEGNTQLQIRK